MPRNAFALPYDRNRNDTRSGPKLVHVSVTAHTRPNVTAHTLNGVSARTTTTISATERHSTFGNHVTAHAVANLHGTNCAFRYSGKSKRTSSPNQFSLITDITNSKSVLLRPTALIPNIAPSLLTFSFGCKNIENFTSQCKNIENFTFQCKRIAKSTTECNAIEINDFEPSRLRWLAHIAHKLNRQPIKRGYERPYFFRSSRARSAGSRGSPLPTQFGTAKLYRG